MTLPAHTPGATPLSLQAVLNDIQATINSQPEPARTDLRNAISWLEPAIKTEADAAIVAMSNKVPVAGGIIGGAIEESFNKALDAGLVAIVG